MNLFDTANQEEMVGSDLICYRIKCTINDRRYIGITCSYKRRIDEHFSLLRKQSHYCKSLQYDFIEYGEDAFVHQIIYKDKYIDSIQRKLIEKIALSVEKNLYNTNKFIEFNSSKRKLPNTSCEFILPNKTISGNLSLECIKKLLPEIIKHGEFSVVIPESVSAHYARGRIFNYFYHLKGRHKALPKIKTMISENVIAVKLMLPT